MKKKLLLVITKSNFGGAQRYVYDVATNLKDTYDVTVLSGGTGVLQDKLKEQGIRVIPLLSLQRDISVTKDFKAFFELIRIFKKEKPDIVHLNSSKVGGMGALAARITGVPRSIFTGHGWAFNEKRPFLQKKIISFFHWLTIVLNHTTIAVSEKTKQDIISLPFISKRIKVLYNGIGAIDFIPKEKAREMLGIGMLKSETLVIGTISELHKNKGLDIALEGFKHFHEKTPESHFVIIGGGEEKESLEKYINENGLQNSVALAGFIKDAARYLKAFDIFTLTSRTEAFPYVPLEAGLAGLPVIATKVGGIPEMITDHAEGLLIEPENLEAFAMALEELVVHKEAALSYAQALHNKVMASFSHATMISKLIDTYEKPFS